MANGNGTVLTAGKSLAYAIMVSIALNTGLLWVIAELNDTHENDDNVIQKLLSDCQLRDYRITQTEGYMRDIDGRLKSIESHMATHDRQMQKLSENN